MNEKKSTYMDEGRDKIYNASCTKLNFLAQIKII